MADSTPHDSCDIGLQINEIAAFQWIIRFLNPHIRAFSCKAVKDIAEKFVVNLCLHRGDPEKYHFRHVLHGVFDFHRGDRKQDEQLHGG